MDEKTRKIISDMKWWLKRQEFDAVKAWWISSLPVDEKFFKQNPLLIIANERMTEKIKRFLIQACIPRHFFDGLNQIKFDPLLYDAKGKKLRGCYLPVSRRIVLSYDLKKDPDQLKKTLFHELGHHCSDQLTLSVPGAEKMFQKLKASFPVAFRSKAEMFAQLFSMAYAGGEERDALEFIFNMKIDPSILKSKKQSLVG